MSQHVRCLDPFIKNVWLIKALVVNPGNFLKIPV